MESVVWRPLPTPVRARYLLTMTIAPLLLVLTAAPALATEPAAAQPTVETPPRRQPQRHRPTRTSWPATAAPGDGSPTDAPAGPAPAGLPAPTYRAQGPTGFTPRPWRTPAPAHPAQAPTAGPTPRAPALPAAACRPRPPRAARRRPCARDAGGGAGRPGSAAVGQCATTGGAPRPADQRSRSAMTLGVAAKRRSRKRPIPAGARSPAGGGRSGSRCPERRTSWPTTSETRWRISPRLAHSGASVGSGPPGYQKGPTTVRLRRGALQAVLEGVRRKSRGRHRTVRRGAGHQRPDLHRAVGLDPECRGPPLGTDGSACTRIHPTPARRS